MNENRVLFAGSSMTGDRRRSSNGDKSIMVLVVLVIATMDAIRSFLLNISIAQGNR